MAQLFDDTLTASSIAGFARVALEQGIDAAQGGLTYAVPASLDDLEIGERVKVPLGKRDKAVAGYVIERMDTSDLDAGRAKMILVRDTHAASLPSDLIELARWMANYYCCPLGMVLVSMLPAAVKRGAGAVTHTLVSLDAAYTDDTDRPKKLTRLQRAVFDVARAAASEGKPELDLRELADRAGARSITPVRHLIEKGILVTRRETAIRASSSATETATRQSSTVPELNPAQAEAVEKLGRRIHRGFSVDLLYGVTGSGKTEVYFRVIQRLLAERPGTAPDAQSTEPVDQPPGVIVLVPEIILTPQTVARFVNRFRHVAVLHSGLTHAQRHEQWRLIREGKANIVVGARSAIFAPVPRLGLIIVDEEQESSYKQDQLPRFHARDVAIKRGQLLGIPVVLGSATPSLESYFNAIRTERYGLVRLPERVAGLQLPWVEIVDMREQRRARYALTGKSGVHLLSLRLEAALGKAKQAGAQAMLLLNRRGYANYIACPDHRCGWLMDCEHCDATMAYHKDRTLPTGGFVQCHHCHAEQLLPNRCPQCRSHKVTVFGLGTQRVEEELARNFPDLRVSRMDSDSMRKGRDYDETLEAFRRGQFDILVGTQMIAKGLDFPNVRLVGVISADTVLHLPDFRSSERTFQLIAQVAGRSGRGDQPGMVIVQSFSPTDPAILLAAEHDYDTFAEREIELRRSVGLPPTTRMARVVVRYRDPDHCRQVTQRLLGALAHYNERLQLEIELRGPAPCPIARIAGYHRQQIELIAPAPEAAARLQRLMTALRNAGQLHSDAHTAVDVDPVTMM